METRKLGTTDLQLTVLGLGTWAIGGGEWRFGWGYQDEQEAIKAVVAAIDAGINWIDTAAVYGGGQAEELVGRALQELGPSRRPIVATKCGRLLNSPDKIDKVLKRESILSECEQSLKRLQIDCIDLYQLHWPEPDEDIEEGWSTLVELKKQGKVKEIGVSNHSVDQLKRLQEIHPVASLQPPYSMLTADAEKKLLPFCSQEQIGVVCYSPMAKGLLTGKVTKERVAELPENDHRSRDPQFQPPLLDAHLGLLDCLRPIADSHGWTLAQLALAWVLRRNEVTSAIVGVRRPDQVDELVQAAGCRLTDQEQTTIEQLLAGHQQAIRMGVTL